MPRRKAGTSLSDRAYERIRADILAGRHAIGAPLSRRRLAEDLDMSLIPVAEALLRLEGEGLVESRPRVGTRVKIPSPDEVRGRYLVREALESQAARVFAAVATPAQREALRQAARRLDELADGERRPQAALAFEQAHLRLHMQIAACSNCPELVEAIERSRVLIFNWLFNLAVDAGELPPRWHGDLADALCQENPLHADAAMRRHVTYRREEIIAAFGALPSAAGAGQPIIRGPQRRTLEKAQGGRAAGVVSP